MSWRPRHPCAADATKKLGTEKGVKSVDKVHSGHEIKSGTFLPESRAVIPPSLTGGRIMGDWAIACMLIALPVALSLRYCVLCKDGWPQP
jgi:hypothetical protein